MRWPSFTRGLTRAVAHLSELGHTRVAFFGHAARMNRAALQQMWSTIVDDFELNVASSPLIIDKDYWHWQSHLEPERALAQIRDAGATALICRDDPVTLTLVHHAQRLGWHIPDDLSVIAYDDEMAMMCNPPLTAISPVPTSVALVGWPVDDVRAEIRGPRRLLDQPTRVEVCERKLRP